MHADHVIEVDHLSKRYNLGFLHEDMLSQQLVRLGRALWRRPQRQPSGDDVDKSHVWALKDVNFSIKPGELVGVIGANGAGKSTLLKVLSRITYPTQGQVRVRGRLASLLEVGTGFHPELSGRENIFLNGSIIGMTRAEIAQKFDAIVEFSELNRFIDTPVKRYSSGMFVRLAFAVAAHLEPDILVVDEVLAVGDAAFQKKCLGQMSKVGEGGRTVLFVSHNMGLVSKLCERCLLMHGGQLVQDGPTQDVIPSYMQGLCDREGEYLEAEDLSTEVNLRRVAIENDAGDVQSELTYDGGFHIAIDYQVNAPVDRCRLGLVLCNAQGVETLETADFDADARQLDLKQPGLYRARIRIPGAWLNVGRYTVRISLTRGPPKKRYANLEAVHFRISDVGAPWASVRAKTGISAPLRPRLQWEFRCEEASRLTA